MEVIALLWSWLVDKKAPYLYDWVGGGICLLGMTIILWGGIGTEHNSDCDWWSYRSRF